MQAPRLAINGYNVHLNCVSSNDSSESNDTSDN